MAITLLHTNNMIVKGSYHQSLTGEPGLQNRMQYIVLDFTIQVNGKLANFSEELMLGRQEGIEDLEIVDWDKWNLIVKILYALGYKLHEEQTEQVPLCGLIKGWTESILKSV